MPLSAIFIYFCSLSLWVTLFWIFKRHLVSYSISTVLLIFLLFTQYLFIPLSTYHYDFFRETLFKTVALNSFAITTFILGLLAAPTFLSYLPRRRSKHYVLHRISSRKLFAIISTLTFIVLVLFVLPRLSFSITSIISLYLGTDTSSSLRESSFLLSSNSSSLYPIATTILPCFLLFSTFLSQSPWTFSRIFSVTLLFIIVALLQISTFQKFPISQFLFGTSIAISLKLSPKYRPVFIMSSIAIIIILLSLYIKTVFPGTPFINSLASIISRIGSGQFFTMHLTYSLFETYQPLLGDSFPNPGQILPINNLSLAALVADSFSLSNLAQTSASAPTAFWGEAYANFSLVGITLVCFLTAVVLKSIDLTLQPYLQGPYLQAVYLQLVLHYSTLAFSGFSGFLFDPSGVALFSLFALFCLTRPPNPPINFKSSPSPGFRKVVTPVISTPGGLRT